MDNQLDTSSEEQNKPTVTPNTEVNYFGLANYRNQNRKFGIKLDDRRRHMYVVGKTGMGKTTLLENMVLNDIYAGHGVGYIDPHGDTAEKILDYIPANRINDVVYFNPGDLDYPIGFNILETIRPEQKHLVASGLMGVFKKIWPDVWSSRMEYILNNTILALLDFPGTTLLGINRLLADADYRRRVVNNTKDPVIKAFWQTEFANYNDKYKQEAVAPIQNKIGQFLSASVIRNIVAQVKSRIDIREIMDEKKIFIMNLSKGRIGEDNSRLLGGMLVTKIQLSAMERVDMPEAKRPDFFFYVDEFQNFATEAFANILSEARKYRLDLIMAHQYMEQLEEEVLAAVIGNVGSIITFRVGSTDAEILAKEFIPTFVEEDLVNLPKFHIYLKLMIDGVASRPFSALTLPPIAQSTGSMEKVVKVSRERYAVSRDTIEGKIAKWSGMVIIPGDEAGDLEVDADEAMFTDVPNKKVEVKPAVQPPVKTEIISEPVAKPIFRQTPQPFNAPQHIAPPQLSESAKKRRRKKKNRSNQNFVAGNQVILGDPSQRGISLNALSPAQPPRQQPAHQPVQQPIQPNKPVQEITPPKPNVLPDYLPPKTVKPGQVEKID
ncbi:MAG: type IV secretion system DNA-binding domain-containing protein [Candidatus Magasanikbacteria bacterium]